MTVYVAQRGYDYEGFEIIGIFTTKEAAQECCDNDVHPSSGRKCGDSYDVAPHELDITSVKGPSRISLDQMLAEKREKV